MSRKNIISKIVAGETAIQLDIRVINMPLYPSTDSVVNVFYGYYKSGGLRIENSIAEGNLQLGDLISGTSKTALLNALTTEVGAVTSAILNFNQLNNNLFALTYEQDGGVKSITLSGSYFTDAECLSVRNAVLSSTDTAYITPTRRKKITVNSTTSQTDYPVTITLHNITGTDTTTDIYLGSNVRSDWGDVRILSNSLVALPFAVVSKTSTSITVTFSSSLINGDSYFYVYYDRPAVAGTITKFGVTTDQHYDPAETYVGRDHALTRLDNFATRIIAYVPDAILEGGDKIGAVTTDPTARLGIMNSVTAKHSGAASSIGCAHYLWGWGNHDFENITFSTVQANYSSLPGLVAGTLYGTWEDDNYCYISLDAQYNPADQSHLNSNQGYGYINTVQLTWLTNTLAAATKPCIVFCHQLLCEADTERIFLTKETYHVQNRTAVRTILENSGKVLFVLQGHTHMTSHNVINGIPYLNIRDVNEPTSPTYGWDTPNSVTLNGSWGIIEVDRSTMMIKFRQETQVGTTVETIYEFFIPYRTIYDTDYGNNPEKVFALSNAALYSKASIVSDATDMYVNDDTFVIAKPASIYDGDPILSDRTIKIYGITSNPNYGRVKFGFAPQTSGTFQCKFSARLSSVATKYIKLQQSGAVNISAYIAFMSTGNINILNGDTSTIVQAYSINTWYNFIVIVNMTTGKIDVTINGTLVASQFSFFSAGVMSINELEVTTEAGNMFLDFFRIDKYVSPTPSITAIGTEENI